MGSLGTEDVLQSNVRVKAASDSSPAANCPTSSSMHRDWPAARTPSLGALGGFKRLLGGAAHVVPTLMGLWRGSLSGGFLRFGFIKGSESWCKVVKVAHIPDNCQTRERLTRRAIRHVCWEDSNKHR